MSFGKGTFAAFIAWYERTLEGYWFDVSRWWRPIITAFTVQTAVHFLFVSLYILQVKKMLPFVTAELGTPYSVSTLEPPGWLLVLSPALARYVHAFLIAPILEEIGYRGPVWLGVVSIQNRWVQWFIIACAALVWSLLHGRPPLITAEIFIAGFWAGWIVIKTRNLIPAILFHSLWNIVVYARAALGLFP